MKRLEAIELPAEEIAHQKALMHEFASLEQRPRTYCVVTYGCQMNAHDSEKLEGMLAEMGMKPAESRESADFVIFQHLLCARQCTAPCLRQCCLAEGTQENPPRADGCGMWMHDAAEGNG